MSLVTSKEILADAQKNGYAVGAFNVENMEMVQAVIEAAEEENAPVILQTTPSTVKYASMFEPSTVALHGVRCNQYKGGGYVAVLGCGTIGIFTLQWCRIFGGKKVVAFDIDDGRLELARRMGADEVVNTRDENFMEKAMVITGGHGYDYVFEAAGNPITMQMGFRLAANKAHVCFIGTPHVEMTFTQAMWENMNRKEFLLTGSWMSYSAPFPGEEWELTAHYFATGELKFDPGFIYRTFPLSEAAQAFDLFHHPETVHGKIMLVNG